MSNVTRLKNTQKGNLYRDVSDWVRFNKNVDDKEEIEKIINSMSTTEVIDTWLRWNGIQGYTESIVELVTIMYEDY